MASDTGEADVCSRPRARRQPRDQLGKPSLGGMPGAPLVRRHPLCTILVSVPDTSNLKRRRCTMFLGAKTPSRSVWAVLVACVIGLAALLPPLSRSTAAASTQAGQVRAAAAKRACVGWRLQAWMNQDGMTATYRFTPVFRGGWPPRPWTSAAVWFNGNRSPWPFGQPGRHVDVFAWYSWRITALVLKVSSGELALGGKVYRCPNHRYR